MEMALAAEQPLKKRKLYDPVQEPPQSLPQGQEGGFVSPPPSQDEILRKRRNKDEIRNLYDSYRRIKYCVSKKDDRFRPDFEQAYLSLITASRGCSSVLRILAQLIPRYASHCPTALEAAAKVAINMYNWSVALVVRGEDSDGVAFQTAKACVFGLVEICGIASSEAPTSSVIQGICSAVFLIVLNFFVTSFDGKDIYKIGYKSIAKLQDSSTFLELKQEVAEEHGSTLSKLFNFRALSLLRIFFCCPKNLLAACFETFKTSEADVASQRCGTYFLRQITSLIGAADESHLLDKVSDGVRSHSVSIETFNEADGINAEKTVSNHSQIQDYASLQTKNCLVQMVLSKDPSLRDWFLSKYKNFSKSMDPQTMSNISSALQEVFGSVMGPIQEADSREHSDEESSDASKCVNRRYLVPRISNQHEGSVERSEMDKTSKVCSASAGDALIDDRNPAENFSTQSVISRGLVGHRDIDIESLNENSKRGSQGSESMKDLNSVDNGGSSQLRSSMKSAFVNSDFPSPVDKRPVELGSTAFEVGRHLSHVDKNQISNTHVGFSAMKSTGEGVFAPLGQHSSGQYNYLSSDQIAWYFDGDSAAMDIFSASNQLWLGSLGPDASEPLVKFQFEQFGQVEVFLYFPIKGFALVEYRNIMDAIKAREHMRGSSPWGACLQVKFLDAGLGSRGSVNGVAVGSSCHVYVGNVSSQWIKDDILNGMMRVGFRHPRMVTDLITESALLMEFETAQEATSVMVHLRQLRKENGYHVATNKALTLKPGKADVSRSYMDGARFVPASIHHELRSNHSGSMSSSVLGSPSVPAAFDSPIETCKMRKSQLSSLLLALSSKYNISQNSYSFDNHSSRRYHAAKRDEENVPTNTLCMGLPDNSSPFLTDDELMTVCSHAVGNVGSIVRLTRASIQTGSYWFIEFSSVDAAVTAMKNIRSCPGMFFQIEFSQPGNTPFITSDRSNQELVSPIVSQNCETIGQSGHAYPSNWTSYGAMEVTELAGRNVGNFDGYDNNAAKMDLSQAKSHPASHVNQQIWTYKKPETELQFSATGSRLCTPMAVQGPTVLPPQPMQASPFMRPVYYTPNNSWDAHSANRPLPMSHPNPSIVANNLHFNVPAPPFLPASVTPLAQLPGSTLQHVDHMVTAPPLPTLSSIPPPPSMPPPLPPSPPPLPFSQPPMVPPPPSSPPLQSAVGPFYQGSAGQDLPYQWQGVLCKSGVHYCKIYARREDSDTCKYSNAIPEPTEWPARLDMTKRTDFQHVKSTFSSTPPNKREVCRLLPSTSDDHKGFQDFISYLKQRECAGVIKIPAVKNMWARLLFILPYSHETCSMIAIPRQPEKCLIALILPKETNFEWV